MTLYPLFRGIIAFLVSLIAMFVFSIMTTSSSHASQMLGSYISSVCKKNCVDETLLTVAVQEAARETNINPLVLVAIIKEESNFNVKATNLKNGKSIGLAQIQIYWHRDKFRGDQYDVFANVRAGALIYRSCVDKHRGNRERALWCYNGHQKHGYHYVSKVMKTYDVLREKGIRL